MNHFAVYLKLTHSCKSTILHFLKKRICESIATINLKDTTHIRRKSFFYSRMPINKCGMNGRLENYHFATNSFIDSGKKKKCQWILKLESKR